MSQWKPNDVIRLVALLGGFSLFGVGAYMLSLGVHASGHVDLKASVLSGTLQTSSAGLYVCFFSLFIVVFVLTTASIASPSEGAPPKSAKFRLFGALVGMLTLALAAAAVVPSESRVGFTFAITVLLMLIIAAVTSILRYGEE